MKCANCKKNECVNGKDCTNIKEETTARYNGEDLKIMKTAAILTDKFYMEKTRLEELIFFATQMNYQKLGLAFCIGLQNEAAIVDQILSKEFRVFSACCRICGMERTAVGLAPRQKDNKIATTCNPIGQTEIFNRKKTDLNIILGLCMGHDILFTKHSKAPVTTLAVKDRVLTHNPLGVVYSGYYRKKRFSLAS